MKVQASYNANTKEEFIAHMLSKYQFGGVDIFLECDMHVILII